MTASVPKSQQHSTDGRNLENFLKIEDGSSQLVNRMESNRTCLGRYKRWIWGSVIALCCLAAAVAFIGTHREPTSGHGKDHSAFIAVRPMSQSSAKSHLASEAPVLKRPSLFIPSLARHQRLPEVTSPDPDPLQPSGISRRQVVAVVAGSLSAAGAKEAKAAADINIEEMQNKMKEQTQQALEESKKTLEEAGNDAKKSSEKAINEAKKSSEKAMKEASKTLEEASDDAKKSSEKAISEAKKSSEKAMKEATKTLEEASNDAKESSEKAINEAKKSSEKAMKEAKKSSEKAMKEATKTLEEASDDAKKSSEKAMKEAKKSSEKAMKEAKKSSEKAITDAKKEVKQAIDAI